MDRRLPYGLVGAVIFSGVIWWAARAPGTLISDQISSATVTAVELRQRGPDKGTHKPVLATVELPDGGRAKVWVSPPGPAVGAKIKVRIQTFDEGSRKLTPVR
jgi:hypothetical protein